MLLIFAIPFGVIQFLDVFHDKMFLDVFRDSLAATSLDYSHQVLGCIS